MRSASAVVVAMAALALASCAAPDPPGDEPTAGPPAAEAAIDRDFPDPDVLEVDGTFYAYATNGNNRNVQVASSPDMTTWTVLREDALPSLPSWVIPGKTWAPEVTQVAPAAFVLYFTATNYQPARQCIGAATAASPTGPFVVQGDGMLVCPDEEGGAIDASTFRQGDQLYLLWKNDGNCCGLETWISAAPLTGDGLALAAPGIRLFTTTLPWEGELVEAPTVVERDGVLHAFYSANSYGNDHYAIGHATAAALAGPWTKDDEPFFATDTLDGRFRGPGGQDVVNHDGKWWLVFHGWDPDYSYRGMFVEPLMWGGDDPEVGAD